MPFSQRPSALAQGPRPRHNMKHILRRNLRVRVLTGALRWSNGRNNCCGRWAFALHNFQGPVCRASSTRCAEVGEVEAVFRQLDQLVFTDEAV